MEGTKPSKPHISELTTEDRLMRRFDMAKALETIELLSSGMFSGRDAKKILDAKEWLEGLIERNDFVR